MILHTDCGMRTFAEDAFVERAGGRDRRAAGVGDDGLPRRIDADVRRAVARVRASPFLLHVDAVRGFVYEVETGRLREVPEPDWLTSQVAHDGDGRASSGATSPPPPPGRSYPMSTTAPSHDPRSTPRSSPRRRPPRSALPARPAPRPGCCRRCGWRATRSATRWRVHRRYGEPFTMGSPGFGTLDRLQLAGADQADRHRRPVRLPRRPRERADQAGARSVVAARARPRAAHAAAQAAAAAVPRRAAARLRRADRRAGAARGR